MSPGEARLVSGTALTIVALLLLRLVAAAYTPLTFDEAYYWTWSKHLAGGYYDHPPMVAVVIRLGTLIGGDTELGPQPTTGLQHLIVGNQHDLVHRLPHDLEDALVGLAAGHGGDPRGDRVKTDLTPGLKASREGGRPFRLDADDAKVRPLRLDGGAETGN